MKLAILIQEQMVAEMIRDAVEARCRHGSPSQQRYCKLESCRGVSCTILRDDIDLHRRFMNGEHVPEIALLDVVAPGFKRAFDWILHDFPACMIMLYNVDLIGTDERHDLMMLMVGGGMKINGNATAEDIALDVQYIVKWREQAIESSKRHGDYDAILSAVQSLTNDPHILQLSQYVKRAEEVAGLHPMIKSGLTSGRESLPKHMTMLARLISKSALSRGIKGAAITVLVAVALGVGTVAMTSQYSLRQWALAIMTNPSAALMYVFGPTDAPFKNDNWRVREYQRDMADDPSSYGAEE